MNTQEQQELEKKALDQLLSGKSLFGKDGAFAPMLKAFLLLQLQLNAQTTYIPDNDFEQALIDLGRYYATR
jgi:hypothetical protein